MAIIRVSTKGKVLNPVVSKIILVGENDVEIKLEHPTILTAKQALCIAQLAEFYTNNKDKYGSPEDYINNISNNFTQIDFDTQKGRIQAAQINIRLLNKLKRHIETMRLIDLYEKGLIGPR